MVEFPKIQFSMENLMLIEAKEIVRIVNHTTNQGNNIRTVSSLYYLELRELDSNKLLIHRVLQTIE